MPEVVTDLSTKDIALEMQRDLSTRVKILADNDPSIVPGLAIVTDNFNYPPTKKYVNLKKNKAHEIGITCHSENLENASVTDIVDAIYKLNYYPGIDGIIAQLPLAISINTERNTDKVVSTIEPEKDVDGLGPDAKYVSATASAIMEILEWYGIDFTEQEVSLWGLGRLVNKPLRGLLQKSGAKYISTVTKEVPEIDRLVILNRAPIIITAMGVADAFTPDLFEDLSRPRVLIDAGTAEQKSETAGDVSDELRLEAVKNNWSITRQSGWGVGSLTVRTLLSHVVDAAEKRAEAS